MSDENPCGEIALPGWVTSIVEHETQQVQAHLDAWQQEVMGVPLTATSHGIEPPYRDSYIRVLKPRESLTRIDITWNVSFAEDPEDGWDAWPLDKED